jgi:hypothetical protein
MCFKLEENQIHKEELFVAITKCRNKLGAQINQVDIQRILLQIPVVWL